MTMRISTPQIFSSNIENYNRGYASMAKTQEQIASGVRIQTPADDPVGAARLLQLQQQQALLTQYSTNTTTATNSLNQEQSVLDSITNVLQKARELTLEAGDGSLTDEDRGAIADELGQIQKQLLTLMNSKDASGNYLFSGSKSSVQPFVLNADGTYSYQGDQNTLSLQVSESLNISTGDSCWDLFEMATNASRTTSALASNPNTDGTQRVFVSQGTVTTDSTYDSTYKNGAPYTLNVLSGTQYQILDKDGNDVTSEASTNGSYDATSTDSNAISFRGAQFQLDVSLPSSDDSSDMDSLVTGYSFTLGAASDNISVKRSATNTSTAQITSATVSNSTTYTTQFPSGGVQIKFTSGSDYEVYALPTSSGATPLSSGTLGATYPQTVNIAGVDVSISAAPATGDQFSLTGSSPQKQNILNTIGQLRDALNTSTANNPQAQLTIRDTVASALTNIDNANNKALQAQSSIGSRLNTLDVLDQENQSLSLTNTTTQSSIRDTDMAAATSKLVLQQTMLEAAQASFARISQLSLFDKL
ncbi:MAG: Flagellar hook-associated protein 3 [Stenotrophomonas maltophilia]|nr:MAG: Flagellar hook-associated protein 3 [Stenotrophomonas maltophilia]